MVLVALVLALLLAQSKPASGVDGIVVLWPTCPVERADHPCQKPVAATIDVLGPSGDVLANVHRGDDGKFSVSLAPGSYVLRPEPLHPGSVMPWAREQSVTVKAGEFVHVRLIYDTGIR